MGPDIGPTLEAAIRPRCSENSCSYFRHWLYARQRQRGQENGETWIHSTAAEEGKNREREKKEKTDRISLWNRLQVQWKPLSCVWCLEKMTINRREEDKGTKGGEFKEWKQRKRSRTRTFLKTLDLDKRQEMQYAQDESPIRQESLSPCSSECWCDFVLPP